MSEAWLDLRKINMQSQRARNLHVCWSPALVKPALVSWREELTYMTCICVIIPASYGRY